MPFQRDANFAAEIGPAYGEYLVTDTGASGRMHAHLFRNWGRVQAYVSYPPGVPWGEVTEPFYSELWRYAREQGYADHFEIIRTA
jgi:hypothetical protein